jgi:predicted nucleic acid-binding Zn ribbon protein
MKKRTNLILWYGAAALVVVGAIALIILRGMI